MPIKVVYLTFDLHLEGNVAPNPTGRLGYEEWLASNLSVPSKLMDVWYGEGMSVDVVTYDDT